MAYFPNGTSGMVYMERYCCRCKNWKDLDDGRGFGCPIWDIHMIFNYDAVGKNGNKDIKQILDTLIPTTKDKLYADKCSMFDWNEKDLQGQMKFKETENENEKVQVLKERR